MKLASNSINVSKLGKLKALLVASVFLVGSSFGIISSAQAGSSHHKVRDTLLALGAIAIISNNYNRSHYSSRDHHSNYHGDVYETRTIYVDEFPLHEEIVYDD